MTSLFVTIFNAYCGIVHTFLRVALCMAFDIPCQLDLLPKTPCMMMIGGLSPPSATNSYDVLAILMGSSLVLDGRR